jgi:hypothetical protein
MLVTLLLCCAQYGDCERSHSWEPIGGGAYLLHVDGRPVGTYYNGRYRAFLFDAAPDRRYRGDRETLQPRDRESPFRNGNGNGNGRTDRPVIPGPYYEGPTFGMPRMEGEPRNGGPPPRNGGPPRPRPRTYETREPWSFDGPRFTLPHRARPDRDRY